MSRSDDKRPIDRIRESALSMQIGTPEDGAVSVMIDMGNALYAIQTADRLDPERTNLAVPNTQQRLLSIGTHDSEVARVFLTTYTMFKSAYLGTSFPEREAAMMEIRSSLLKAIKEAVAGFKKVVAKNRSITLPALGNVEERCDAFVQKIGHAIDTLKAVARLFYPNELSRK